MWGCCHPEWLGSGVSWEPGNGDVFDTGIHYLVLLRTPYLLQTLEEPLSPEAQQCHRVQM
jgi:hypothetical protein